MALRLPFRDDAARERALDEPFDGGTHFDHPRVGGQRMIRCDVVPNRDVVGEGEPSPPDGPSHDLLRPVPEDRFDFGVGRGFAALGLRGALVHSLPEGECFLPALELPDVDQDGNTAAAPGDQHRSPGTDHLIDRRGRLELEVRDGLDVGGEEGASGALRADPSTVLFATTPREFARPAATGQPPQPCLSFRHVVS